MIKITWRLLSIVRPYTVESHLAEHPGVTGIPSVQEGLAGTARELVLHQTNVNGTGQFWLGKRDFRLIQTSVRRDSTVVQGISQGRAQGPQSKTVT